MYAMEKWLMRLPPMLVAVIIVALLISFELSRFGRAHSQKINTVLSGLAFLAYADSAVVRPGSVHRVESGLTALVFLWTFVQSLQSQRRNRAARTELIP